jgi:hypothetical protein
MELLDVSTSESIPLEDVPCFVTEHTKSCTTLKHVNQLGYHPNRIVASSQVSLENEEKTLREKFFFLKRNRKGTKTYGRYTKRW